MLISFCQYCMYLYLNVLQPKQRSNPIALNHDDIVKLGETCLLCHIHPGTDTCDDCEPGVVMATALSAQQEKGDIKCTTCI